MYCSHKDKRKAIIILLPFLTVLFLFVYGFIFWSVRVSFSAWDSILPDMSWVGLRNYQELMGSLRFKTDIVNTIYFTLFFIAICIVGGFILSYLLFVQFAEAGYPTITLPGGSFRSLMVKKGVPADAKKWLADTTEKAFNSANFQKFMKDNGLIPSFSKLDEFAQYDQTIIADYEVILKDAGLYNM